MKYFHIKRVQNSKNNIYNKRDYRMRKKKNKLSAENLEWFSIENEKWFQMVEEIYKNIEWTNIEIEYFPFTPIEEKIKKLK